MVSATFIRKSFPSSSNFVQQKWVLYHRHPHIGEEPRVDGNTTCTSVWVQNRTYNLSPKEAQLGRLNSSRHCKNVISVVRNVWKLSDMLPKNTPIANRHVFLTRAQTRTAITFKKDIGNIGLGRCNSSTIPIPRNEKVMAGQ